MPKLENELKSILSGIVTQSRYQILTIVQKCPKTSKPNMVYIACSSITNLLQSRVYNLHTTEC
jgi:hypothetical protein